MNPFRVLTIDGGGMRGLYTTALLQTLVQRFDVKFVNNPPDIGKSFNLICGTSTGAILAAGLAAGIELSKIQSLYTENGRLIFPQSFPSPDRSIALVGWISKIWNKPAANEQALRKILNETFGNLTLEDLYKKRKIALCVPAVDALTHKAWVFKTPHDSTRQRDNLYRIVDVCLASSSAPIYFPVTKIQNPVDKTDEHFVDGGLWANNPIIVGLTEALRLADPGQPIDVLSVGTCDQPTGDPNSLTYLGWGLKQWQFGKNIIEMSLSAQSFGHTHTARFIGESLTKAGRKTRVVRLDQTNKSPQQYSAIGIDRSDKVAIDTLIKLGKTDADAIHSGAISEASEKSALICEIFKNLAELEINRKE